MEKILNLFENVPWYHYGIMRDSNIIGKTALEIKIVQNGHQGVKGKQNVSDTCPIAFFLVLMSRSFQSFYENPSTVL